MSAWTAGAIVGEYRLLEQLGAGGAGAVWRVQHVPTGVERALKTLHAEGEDQVTRFKREAEALAALSHPNVARVHTSGEAGGRLYLVLDLAPGGDLSARLKQGPFEPEAARALIRELADGLAHVHERGLLHRDLKPQNVLFDDSGRALLVDFGLTRVIDASSLTNTGQILGTPQYMSPEQADGTAVDVRTDVYGLGAVFYHLLTGKPPFVGSPVAVLRAVLMDDPTPPRKLNPAVPEELERVCLKALGKEPEDRFATVREFAAALDDPPPPETPPLPPAVIALVALTVIAALAATATVVLSGRGAEAPQPERPSATSPVGSEPAAATPTAAEVHPVDARLAALEPIQADELRGYSWGNNPLHGSLDQLLSGEHTLALHEVYRWLRDEGSLRRGAALIYHVAQQVEGRDDKWGRFALKGWWVLGEDMRNPALRRRLWPDDEAWEGIKHAVVRECYVRAARGGHSKACVFLGRFVLGELDGSAFGFAYNAQEAQSWFRLTLESTSEKRREDTLMAKLKLAELALKPEVLVDPVPMNEALRYAEEAVDGLRGVDQVAARAARDALEARLSGVESPR